ncbi:bis(5'-nucleosyl)-tetraphosphatase (symmetrical) YqeK [Pectinatus cerevisiiphilus]|uniref:bis(5'-nucleosyl)-tetraphosphatase (symmetrical) n=1 Tax=Pectinatus cerevisiiphilus TaxID=86956 RepID=A0A4R3K599_9FIRM|nr:bis(5'-nucleosyl)-tetraphosphatase (symmetrical) YqeK [Pectinatus cerevisiiphilus]TCS77998.1 putative HD superfamily hydrolase involved in NAD metabolism [Pectinatus cerevisiiphilus]
MNCIDMQEKLRHSLDNEHRYIHSLGVSETAVQLAKRLGASLPKAKIAGLLHDCAREFPVSALLDEARKRNIPIDFIDNYQPILLHAALGAALAKEKYSIDDPEILDAIRLHTTGKENMTLLDKIIYLADMIEPHRQYDGIDEFRKFAESADIDSVMIAAFDRSLSFVIKKGQMIHPQTILARNYLLAQRIDHEK